MPAFPGFPREWFAELRVCARQEVGRLRRLGVPLDEDDAEAYAISVAYFHVTAMTWAPERPFGLARFVMRQRLEGEYVRRPMAQKRGGLVPHVSLEEAHEVEDDPSFLPVLLASSVNPWADVEDTMTLGQLEARRRADALTPQRPVEEVTRQAMYERRQRLLHFARKHKRPFD